MLRFWNKTALGKNNAKRTSKTSLNGYRRGRRAAFEALERRELLAASGAEFDASASLVSPNAAEVGSVLPTTATEIILVDTAEFKVDPHDGLTSLQEAIELADSRADTTIIFADSLGDATISFSYELTISKTITIDGGNRITLDGQGQTRFFYLDGGDANANLRLTNMTLKNGYSTTWGGAIYSWRGGSVQVVNAAFIGNYSEYDGGAIANREGTLTVKNSTFINNTADDGAGAIENSAGTLTVENTTFSGNTSRDDGGAIYTQSGNATILSSTFFGNTSKEYDGGAISNRYGNATIANSVFYGNSASSGGAIYNSNGTTDLYHCTVSGNKAYFGGGLCIYGTINAYNTIVDMNYARAYDRDIFGSLTKSVNNSFDAYGDFVVKPELDAEGNLLNADAVDLHLRVDAKAIDKGSNNYAYGDYDRDGDSRKLGANVDIGAYEFGKTIVVEIAQDSDDPWDHLTSLREAVDAAYDGSTIVFAEKLGKKTIDLQSELNITKAITIDGDNRVTLNGRGENRIFNIEAGTEELPVQLFNMTLKNGFTDELGGAIYCKNAAVKIVNTAIFANEADGDGGAIAGRNALISLYNCTVSGNTASSGGGVAASGRINLYNTIVSHNYAKDGKDNIVGLIADRKSSCVDSDLRFVTAPEFGSNGKLLNADVLDLRLQYDSVGVDMGNKSYLQQEAQRDAAGDPRVFGSAVDIGAYEFGRTIVVNTNADVSNPNDRLTSLREAIDLASDGALIEFAQRLGETTIAIEAELSVLDAITIDGDNRVALDGRGETRLFYIGGGTDETPIQLLNLTFANAWTRGSGAAIFCNESVLTIANAAFVDNKATYGGAIYIVESELTIENTTFSGNTAEQSGGAVFKDGGATSIVNSIFTNNRAEAEGGAVYNNADALTIVNSSFFNNRSDLGGAIYNLGGQTRLYQSTLSGNRGSYGGGVYIAGGAVDAYNTIVAQNYSRRGGDDVFGELAESVKNCIGADPGFVTAPKFDDSGNLRNDEFVNLRLGSGSTLIDAGDDAYVLAKVDLDGVSRVSGAKVDIGAYERTSATIDSVSISGSLFTSAVLTANVSPANGAVSYQWYVSDSSEGKWTPISGAVGKTFAVDRMYAHKYLAVNVTATNNYYGMAFAATSTAVAEKLLKPSVKANIAATSIALSWKAIDHADGYRVEYRQSGESAYKTISTDSTSCVLDDLDPSTSYDIRVKATTTSSDYVNSDRTTLTKRTAIGVKVELTSVKGTTAALVWNDVVGTRYYSVQYRAAGDAAFAEFAQVTEPNCVVSGLNPTSDYECVVVAVGDGTVYDELTSEPVAFTTAAVKKLTKPAFTKTTTTAFSITVRWKPIANAARYLVQYKAESSASYVSYGYTSETDVALVGLDPLTTYTVRVKSVPTNPDYKNSDYSTTTAATGMGVKIKTASVDAKSAALVWNEVPGAQKYLVMSRAFGTSVFREVARVAAPNCTLTGLAPSTAYECRVVAVGDGSVYDELVSETETFTTADVAILTSAPKKLAKPVVSAIATGAFASISWISVDNAAGYLVQYCLASSKTFKTIEVGDDVNSVTLEDLCVGKEYKVRVKAVGSGAYATSDGAYKTFAALDALDAAFAELEDDALDADFVAFDD